MNTKERARRPRGEAKHRREAIAKFRRENTSRVTQQIIDTLKAKQRLADIGMLLSPDNVSMSMKNPAERERMQAELEIEQIWLQLKLGIISPDEQKQLLSGKFDELEQMKPGVYKQLVASDHGMSVAQQIRDKVMPLIRIAGYHTKR